jgi:hypothetical protein
MAGVCDRPNGRASHFLKILACLESLIAVTDDLLKNSPIKVTSRKSHQCFDFGCKLLILNGAEGGIRTPTRLPSPAPQAGTLKKLSGSIFRA